MHDVRIEVGLAVRDLEPTDLADLDWSGGPHHIRALAAAYERSFADQVELVLITLGNGLPIAVGAVDFAKRDAAGELWMLSVRDEWQSLGVGTILITELEDRIRRRGLSRATLGVEHDNPRAAALYQRLGYVQDGLVLDGWPEGPGRSYATVCFTYSKPLSLTGAI
ncbi:GNAT family N-acetyltransferase [Microlunatus elymi]|uniref:GNAT family N-acetyltransferase n=1 Tax=Microlunatus elymi TaxID=2596828 RepID=A0A516Q450_9ACTN|nr:GNAT family N-acetyltransferase [Microlunatus elymi]QDP98219.1 GNAT family N-acetyltransferase [Microlunatus elymi]